MVDQRANRVRPSIPPVQMPLLQAVLGSAFLLLLFVGAVFWSVIGDLVRAASETGRPRSVCGEAASDPELLGKFMDAGAQTVSVSARLIPGLRRAAHSHCGRTVLSQTDRRREGRPATEKAVPASLERS